MARKLYAQPAPPTSSLCRISALAMRLALVAFVLVAFVLLAFVLLAFVLAVPPSVEPGGDTGSRSRV